MRPLDSLCLFPHQRNGNISASEGSCKAQTRFRSDCLSKGYQDRALLLQLGAQRSCAWWPPRVTRPRPGQEEVQERAWMGATQTQVQLRNLRGAFSAGLGFSSFICSLKQEQKHLQPRAVGSDKSKNV